MSNYKKHIILLIKRLLLAIVLFQISRVFFLLINYSHFELPFGELMKIMLFSIRFDWFSIAIFNSLFILLHLIPLNINNNTYYQRFLKVYFIITNAFLLFLNFIDTEYFRFTNKRSTADLFSFVSTGDDTWSLIPQFLKDFWYILLAWLIIIALMIIFYPRFKKRKNLNLEIRISDYIKQCLISVAIIALIFISVRGIGYRPTGMITAARYTSSQNIPLILNTPFTILKTFYKDDIQLQEYYDETSLKDIYSPEYSLYSHFSPKKQNVVIIIMESFSREYIGALNNGHGYTPFLDSLIDMSLVFEYSYANGKKSMEAMPAILCGLPSLMDNPYITSQYSSNTLSSIAIILRQHGYHTSFFHGGKNGTMGFDNFSRLAGIHDYYGKTEYPGPKEDDDGNWGIWDEPYLQYFCEVLNQMDEPFFSTVFTLSSHHPFKVPKQYRNVFKGGKEDISPTIQYADYSLRKFFEAARKTDWYDSTLFILTADHTSPGSQSYYLNQVGAYAVPIILFCPSDTLMKGRVNSYTVQHIDIFPSVLDYLGIDTSMVFFGRSLFDKAADHFSVNYIHGVYQIIDGEYSLHFDSEKTIGLYHHTSDSLLKINLIRHNDSLPPVAISLEKKLKAFIQQYNTRMIKNRLTGRPHE